MSQTAHAARWWPLPVAVSAAIYACVVPAPHPLDSAIVEQLLFGGSALLLAVSATHPTLFARVVALGAVVTAAISRALIVSITTSPLRTDQRVAGIVVWLTIAYLATALTLLSGLSTTGRGSRWWR